MGAGRIAVIGGGNMGEALAKGMVAAGYATAGDIVIAEPVKARRAELNRAHGFEAVPAAGAALSGAEVAVFAVKPQVLEAVVDEVRSAVTPDHLLVSVMAGIPTDRFVQAFGPSTRVIRVMPNTPALIGAGAAALCRGGAATEADLERARKMLEAVGRAVVVPEALMDAVTGLSGSGPAYVFQFIEALADGGVRVGLPREQALLLAAQTVMGAARMLLETGRHPGDLKDMVASPGGTTIAGLHALEAGGLRPAVMNAVVAATQRSRELGGG